MHENTEASRRGLGNFQPNRRTAPGDFQIQPERRSELVVQNFAVGKAVAFVRIYAQVVLVSGHDSFAGLFEVIAKGDNADINPFG